MMGCAGKKNSNTNLCNVESEWRDHNGIDSCSFYSAAESCDKALGKLKIISRLHKNSLEEGVFEGGMSSRWLEISRDSIFYFAPIGDVADRGSCTCKDGMFHFEWEHGVHLPTEAEIHFNDSTFIELRYYDYPFNFHSFL